MGEWVPDKPLPNDRHELFVQHLIDGESGGGAYRNAGYEAEGASARAAASRLLTDVNVQARYRHLIEERQRRMEVKREWIIERLVRNVDRSMQAEPVRDKEGNETGEFTYQGNVANKALELLGKHLGMFVDRHEHSGPGGAGIRHDVTLTPPKPLSEMNDEELDAYEAQLSSYEHGLSESGRSTGDSQSEGGEREDSDSEGASAEGEGAA